MAASPIRFRTPSFSTSTAHRFASALALLLLATPAFAQPGGGGRGGAPPQSPREQAPIDLTGYWVSIVTEDWLYRMVTPAKGDYASVPMSQAGRQLADQWDPAEGNSCKAYGPPGLMRIPGRLHFEWTGDEILTVETDAGSQTRNLAFNADPGGAVSRMGTSVASWEGLGGRGRGGAPADPDAIRPGALKVVTTGMTPGYLRKNGVPYSSQTVVTEFYDIVHQPDGSEYLIIATIVEDPEYLSQPFRTSTHFLREPDGSKFDPTSCVE